ncbi:Leucine-rich repeat protein kinase family protein [Striga hermonthica]|uniref:Leucine-rich repeat protein kinase family protein n=1 Tax=Striga hermonthica TaxID=68872 RepID=A0A9N7MJ07_STRHE|nr:Leucine-rich repeat protein kinase family protein [Striga hermonthica]
MAHISLLLTLFFFSTLPPLSLSKPDTTATTLSLLMTIKSSLDPLNQVLTSWHPRAPPCSSTAGGFEGVACDVGGHVVNISLQGKGLSGEIPPEIGRLSGLTGLYLHFNKLQGVVPKEIANLTDLTDLYLDVNDLSGQIPPEIGQMPNLQVLQLGYNRLNGSIPTNLGHLKKLTVLSLQSNQLTGAIPASLGDLDSLTRLDLSFNTLFGSIPSKLADLPLLKVLDVRNNTLSGDVPLVLQRLNEGFQFANNTGLCGNAFPSLQNCTLSNQDMTKPESSGPYLGRLPSKQIPESANISNALNGAKKPKLGPTSVHLISVLIIVLILAGLFAFLYYRRSKQKVGCASETGVNRPSVDKNVLQTKASRSSSPLVGLGCSSGWDLVAKREDPSTFSQEVLESYMYNLDEVERATSHFSDVNLLGKSGFSAMYKGILRDGTLVAVKCISKVSCNSDEDKFFKGLKLLTSLRHENLVRLRGFCCSRGRGECFLIYEFVPNGNLLQYLDLKDGRRRVVLDWPTRKSIIRGIARGIEYLHGNKHGKPTLVHRNISAEKILIDQQYNPHLSDSGIHKLLADDIIYSALKTSAAMGYLAPEYTSTGKFTEKSDIYAFGMIIFQILSGKSRVTQLNCHGAEISRFQDFIDSNLDGKFEESEAARLGEVALSCTHENPDQRPDIRTLMGELDDICSDSS